MPPGARSTWGTEVPSTSSMALKPFVISSRCSSAIMNVRFTPWPEPLAWSHVCEPIWLPSAAMRFTTSAFSATWVPISKNVAWASFSLSTSRISEVVVGQGPSSNVRAMTLSPFVLTE